MLTPKEAAERVGKSKATILRNIKDGKLSAARDDSKNYHIEPSELARVYGGEAVEPPHEAAHEAARGGLKKANDPPKNTSENSVLRAKLDAAQEQIEKHERELRHREETISDLRVRLDTEGEERRKVTAMLTDQRPRGFWAWLRGR